MREWKPSPYIRDGICSVRNITSKATCTLSPHTQPQQRNGLTSHTMHTRTYTYIPPQHTKIHSYSCKKIYFLFSKVFNVSAKVILRSETPWPVPWPLRRSGLSHGVSLLAYTGHNNISAGDPGEMVNEMMGMFFQIANSECS